MKNIGGSRYSAGEGSLIVRKSDNFVMGKTIDLGSEDSIDNYEEKLFTKEELDAFEEEFYPWSKRSKGIKSEKKDSTQEEVVSED